ncbi:MAG: CheY-like chemotaxis protein [Psychrosphaera sp.]
MEWLSEDKEKLIKPVFKPWKVGIVDDDMEVHKVTRLVLSRFEFEQRQVELISAYSGEEAKQLFKKHNDIALVILDVVMEQEDSGLTVVDFIRNTLKNHYTRIILRTGQPGNAPEAEIVRNFDIDGYRSKTELTQNNLSLLLYTTLRSYRDVVNLQRYQLGLKTIIDSIARLTNVEQVSELASILISQLAILFNSSHTELLIQNCEMISVTEKNTDTWCMFVDPHKHSFVKNQQLEPLLSRVTAQALSQKMTIIEPPFYAYYYQLKSGVSSVFTVSCSEPLSEFNQELLSIFSQNLTLTTEKVVKSSSKIEV